LHPFDTTKTKTGLHTFDTTKTKIENRKSKIESFFKPRNRMRIKKWGSPPIVLDLRRFFLCTVVGNLFIAVILMSLRLLRDYPSSRGTISCSNAVFNSSNTSKPLLVTFANTGLRYVYHPRPTLFSGFVCAGPAPQPHFFDHLLLRLAPRRTNRNRTRARPTESSPWRGCAPRALTGPTQAMQPNRPMW